MSDETSQGISDPSPTDSGSEGKMKVLVVDADDAIRSHVHKALLDCGYHVRLASSGPEGLETAAAETFDLVFCDVVRGGQDALDEIRSFRESIGPATEIVLMAGQAFVETAIEAVEHGANDYICKPFSAGVLQAIASAVEQRRYPSKLIEVPAQADRQEVVINSPVMVEVVRTATRVAPAELSVMIRGESGTGKELIARLIHRKSPRVERPFVAVNCGALLDTLLESELFGHVRGAFPGAETARRGLFEEADGGTLLLDEVTATSPSFQSKLMRALQEGEFCPLGTSTRKRVNVRVLSSTNRDPHALAEQGLFRQDLLNRLQGVSIILPPLRERREDVRIMALTFLAQYSPGGRKLSITRDAMLAIERYNWPGNIRELRQTMQSLAALSTGVIRIEDLPDELFSAPKAKAVMNEVIPEGDLPTLEQLESSYLLRVLSIVGGNKSRAAQVMGVDRKTLYRMIDRQINSAATKPKLS